MIRFATREDDRAVRALWESCFPDEGGFNSYFFSEIYRPDQNLLLFEDQMLCAMTQMLPYRLRIQDQIQEATYIYGACTAPQLRRMGHMAQLLAQTFALDKAAGRAASFLIPQEAWLFGFYEKFGYQKAFYTDTVTWTSRDRALPNGYVLRHCMQSDLPQLAELYKIQTAALPLVVLRTETQWAEQLSQFKALGGGVYGLFDGDTLRAYACVWNGDQTVAQELFSNDSVSAEVLCDALCDRLQTNTLTYTTGGTQQTLGVAKFYQTTAISLGYLNLMFN